MKRIGSRNALVIGLLVAVVAAVTPAGAAVRHIRIGIVEFRQFSEQTTCSAQDAITSTAAGTGAPLTGRLPQFSLERFKRGDCILVKFVADAGGATTATGEAPAPDPAPTFALKFFGPDGSLVHTADNVPLVSGSTDTYGAYVNIGADWPAGRYRVEAVATSAGDIGKGVYKMTVNALGTRLLLSKQFYKPGDTVEVSGVTWKSYQIGRIVRTLVSYPEDPTGLDNVSATGSVTLTRADGTKVTKEFTSSASQTNKGFFSVSFAPADYGNVAAGAADGFVRALTLTASATHTDSRTGEWKTAALEPDSTAIVQFQNTPTVAQVQAKFTSETGWVEPGGEFVHQVEYRNLSSRPAAGAVVSYAIPTGAKFVKATPAPASVSASAVTWAIGSIPSGTDYAAGRRILVTMRALTEKENRTIVYRDLSAKVTMTQSGGEAVTSVTHGPRVTKQTSARFGDRPFPVVLIDYLDAKHSPARPGWYYDDLINQPRKESSLINLYQEMSFGQLFPRGTIPSVEAKDPTFGAAASYRWSVPNPNGVCLGMTTAVPDPTTLVNAEDQSIAGSTTYSPPATSARVADGWYQLPGTQSYYGGDEATFGQYVLRLAGNAGLGIDGACGPTGKAAYDAASIADADIDYNDYDTDRNGLVDFFMFIFRGIGGNGASQVSGYDNIWPHSSSLESYFQDFNGQLGYVSFDQLRDRLERPLWWADAAARRADDTSKLTTKDMGDDLKAYVRVGPYNANPEISTTSVIAHEYGHSLGLPDFYSTSTRDTVENWDLMSNDNSQFMSIFSRQELGWIVPKILAKGSIVDTITESKIDTHRIDAVDAKGVPYTLSGPDVHNGDAWYVPLPHTSLLKSAPSGKNMWWSGQGNDFGCPGHTLDIPLHLMKNAADGDTVTLTFKSWYEIEWDYDYGFVMISTDGGDTFTALESTAGTTTPQAWNPNANTCQVNSGNGITGTSAQTGFPANLLDRSPALDEYLEPTFITDTYDLSQFAGQDVLLRFAYSTDPGLAKRAWFIDDIKVENTTQNKIYLSDDVEKHRPDFISQGWSEYEAGAGTADRGYFLELRDRIGFDFDGRGQADRTAIDWMPGVSLWWTDEFTGDGNTGQGSTDIPRQTPIDARPQAGAAIVRLADAAFAPIPGIDRFTDVNHTDNYGSASAPWKFEIGCFSMRVLDVKGLGAPGATAKIQMAANAPKCRKAAANTFVLGKTTKPPPGRVGGGRGLPATGVADPSTIALVLLAGAALGLRRLKLHRG